MNTIRFAHHRQVLASTLALALTLALSACGDGGGVGDNSDTVSAPSPNSSILQGRWVSSNLQPAHTVIAVPASSGANTPAVDTLWALAQDAGSLYKLTAHGTAGATATVTGQRYTLGSDAVAAVASGSYSTANSQLTLQTVWGESVTFTRSDAMATPLRADQANGRWQAALGSVVVNWTVQSAGTTNNLSGTSTSGCTYSGQSTVVASQSLYKVQFNETCAGAVQSFSGVATLADDSTRFTVVATNAGNTRAVALMMTRHP